MVTDLAKLIGDNISASLSAMHQPSIVQPQSPTSQSSNHAGLSQLKVIVQSDAKAPLFFGVIILMHSLFMNGRTCDTHAEMFGLIMSRLTSKARDVVKALRCSRPKLSATDLPTAVFDILKGNFSELSNSNKVVMMFINNCPDPSLAIIPAEGT